MDNTVAANIAMDARERCAQRLQDIAAGWRKAITATEMNGLSHLEQRAIEAEFYAGVIRAITADELLTPRKLKD